MEHTHELAGLQIGACAEGVALDPRAAGQPYARPSRGRLDLQDRTDDALDAPGDRDKFVVVFGDIEHDVADRPAGYGAERGAQAQPDRWSRVRGDRSSGLTLRGRSRS
jgi:hypothetical protein